MEGGDFDLPEKGQCAVKGRVRRLPHDQGRFLPAISAEVDF